MATAWHWQERFDALDPEEACRRQVLKVNKHITFSEWLRQKKRDTQQKGDDKVAGREEGEATRRECDERFLEWVHKKQLEKRKQREAGDADKTQKLTASRNNNQPFVKPPSLHVNPVTKRSRTKDTTNQGSQCASAKKRATPAQNAANVAEWERRKKREDRVKRKHAQLDRQLQEHAQRLLHLTRWKRKDVVCAYSTNHRPDPKAANSQLLVA